MRRTSDGWQADRERSQDRGIRLWGVLLSLAIGGIGLAPMPAWAQAFVGNRDSKIYHEDDCPSARRLQTRNRVALLSIGQAEAQGFKACRNCRPNVVEENRAEGRGNGGGEFTSVRFAAVTQDQGLRFTRDIAPVLVANCLGCHNAEQKRGDLDMSSFRKLMAGSASGPILVPTKPEESEIILRVTGESTPKMPPGNNRNLASETIDRLKQWIREGALLDADTDPNAPLADIAATPESLRRDALASMTDEERDQKLDEKANERWKRVIPNGSPERVPGDHFVVYSNLPRARVDQAIKSLEKAHATLKPLLNRPSKSILASPEKISVYIFNNRNPFAEFVRTVQSREVENEDMASADLSAEAPYLVVADPLGGQAPMDEDPDSTSRKGGRAAGSRKGQEDGPGGPEQGLDALLVSSLAEEAVRQSDKAPRWLALGLGEYMGAQLEPRSARVARLRAEVGRQYQLGWVTRSQEALGDQGEEFTLRAMGYSLIEFLTSTNRTQVGPFVRGMLEGREKLDEGLQYLFRATREQFLNAWGQWVVTRYGRGR